MDTVLQTLTIDAEFRAIIPRLAADERAQLEANVLAEGCRDALVVWQGILIDGHNRYEICRAHGLPFTVTEMDLPDREAAITWIINNQLGRRNLTPEQASYLRGKRYIQIVKGTAQVLGNSCLNSDDNGQQSTAKLVGAEYKVSERTIRNDGQFAQAVDVLSETLGEDVKQEILSRELDLTKKDVLALGQMEPEEQRQVAGRILAGVADNVTHAVQAIARERKPERASAPDLPAGKYRCIVIDPPWPMQKIEREERPRQGDALDYPVMSLEEITALPVAKLADEAGCHVYLWVTQKYLPEGLRLFEAWGVKYQCVMTWVKPTGMTPYSWMYNTEHVLFGRIGALQLERLGLKLSFDASVVRHSQKPDVFYERVIQASPGPRLEMFARQPRDGFTVWGNEV
jgi:N6-adenosine-specific RNA methylase IME4